MIASFRSRALKRFWERDDKRLLPAQHLKRIEQFLDRLEASVRLTDMNLPGFDFHGLKGNRRGVYSVTVTGNWRVTFRWRGEDAIDVDYEDTH
jgi:proteic killer suppression protein